MILQCSWTPGRVGSMSIRRLLFYATSNILSMVTMLDLYLSTGTTVEDETWPHPQYSPKQTVPSSTSPIHYIHILHNLIHLSCYAGPLLLVAYILATIILFGILSSIFCAWPSHHIISTSLWIWPDQMSLISRLFLVRNFSSFIFIAL